MVDTVISILKNLANNIKRYKVDVNKSKYTCNNVPCEVYTVWFCVDKDNVYYITYHSNSNQLILRYHSEYAITPTEGEKHKLIYALDTLLFNTEQFVKDSFTEFASDIDDTRVIFS